MKRPPVTPIFPKNNGLMMPPCPENLPIRKMDSKNHILRSGGFNPDFTPAQHHNSSQYHSSLPNTSLNCLTIAQHIDTCPICSRLYDTDKTLYILAIIGLLVLCFLMVKRIIKL
ncbi:hypothetical protein IIV22_035R [Invertebrate iridescent virus 22]|uniref:Uncharacterized protein n=1 Tax=Invertebrate iridescent virus 22 TaxID=345198 RepID=S6DCX9_9VIRU|nr:hypothetical protein IIV22_035R [Invertebrate iridescent virus 22]CCV01712.1 hypothetical protein IIV22_035R [Invertebrate iridescent virus 22]